MKPSEIQELMDAKGWSRTKLAAALDMSENGIHCWMNGSRQPRGAAVILMRMWLEEAQSNGHKPTKRHRVAV